MNKFILVSMIGALILMMIGCSATEVLQVEYNEENLRYYGLTDVQLNERYFVEKNNKRTGVEFIDTSPPLISLTEVRAVFVRNEALCSRFFTVEDNYDREVEVRLSGLNPKENGWYTVTVEAVDSSGNQTALTTLALVKEKEDGIEYMSYMLAKDNNIFRMKDEIPPLITLSEKEYVIEDLNDLEILASAYDEYEEKEMEIKADLTEIKEPGVYHVEIYAIDASGNKAKEEIKVTLKRKKLSVKNDPKNSSEGNADTSYSSEEENPHQSEEQKNEEIEEEKPETVSNEPAVACMGGYDPTLPCHYPIIDGKAVAVIATEGLDEVFENDSSLDKCRRRGEELRAEGHDYLCWIIGRNDYQDWGSYLRVDK